MKKKIFLLVSILFMAILIFSGLSYAEGYLYKQNIENYKPLSLVTSREYKFLLGTAPFANGLEAGYKKLWDMAKTIAKEKGFQVKENEDAFKIGVSAKIYMDTQDALLRAEGYVLRKQIKYKKGKPTTSYKFTAKFISPNLYKVLGTSFPLPSQVKSSRKIEENISLDKNGNLRSYFENAIKVKTKKELCKDTFGSWKKLFLGLGNTCINDDVKLLPRVAYSYKVEPGVILFGDGVKGEVEIELWTHEIGGTPFTGEFSFTIKTKDYYNIEDALKNSEDFYKAFATAAFDFAPKDAFKWKGSKVRVLFNMPVEK